MTPELEREIDLPLAVEEAVTFCVHATWDRRPRACLGPAGALLRR